MTASDAIFEHLYVHFPFCARKCPYCDFNSHAGRDDLIDRYIDALVLELERWAGQVRPRTIFVGGGTPTHGDASALERYIDAVRDAFDAAALEEFTIEANPGSLDRAKVRALVRAGVNRVSLGVQSFDDRLLEMLGRVHNAADAVRGVEILRAGGIERLSVDLILATPGQSLADQERDVARAIDLDPEHVSAYVLTFEEGTAFTRLMEEGRMPAPEAERDLAHLHVVCERLAAAGYERYEISNFARGGRVCLHNLAYWRNANWLGVGAGAHSHRDGRRWKNVDDPAAYAAALERSDAPLDWEEHVPPPSQLFESLMMGLRLADGVDVNELSSRHGIDVRTTYEDVIREHVAGGRAVLDGSRLFLTEGGLDLANRVIRDFVP